MTEGGKVKYNDRCMVLSFQLFLEYELYNGFPYAREKLEYD